MPFFASKKAFKDTCLLFLGRVGIGLGQIVCLRVITGLVEPAQIGLYYYILAIGGIFSAFLFQPMNFYTIRSFLIWQEAGTSRSGLLSILRLLFVCAVLCCFLFAIGWRYFADKGQIGFLCFALIPIIMLMESAFGTIVNSINLLQRRGVFVTLCNTEIWGKTLFILLLVLLVKRDAERMLWGQMLSLILMTAGALYILLRFISKNRVAPEANGMNWPGVWKFYWPVALMQVLFWAQNFGYRIPLKMNAGSSGLAVFSVTFGITIGLYTMFQSVFTQLYDPIFWKSIADNGLSTSDLDAYIKNHWPYLLLFTFWMIGISMSAIKVMAADRYHRYYILIAFISITELIRHAGLAFYNITFAMNQNKILILPGVFSFILCMGGTYYLGTVTNPIVATIISLMSAHCVSFFTLGIFVRKKVSFTIPFKELCIAAVLGLFLCSGLFMSGSLKFSATVVGSAVILALGGVIFVLFSYCLFYILSKLECAVVH